MRFISLIFLRLASTENRDAVINQAEYVLFSELLYRAVSSMPEAPQGGPSMKTPSHKSSMLCNILIQLHHTNKQAKLYYSKTQFKSVSDLTANKIIQHRNKPAYYCISSSDC